MGVAAGHRLGAEAAADPAPAQTTLTTLTRGLEVLEVIASSDGTATAKYVARVCGLKPSTCYHLLRTLRALGYVVRTRDGLWDLGPQAGRLSRRIQLRSGPSPELAAILTGLHNRTGESAYIGGWFNHQFVLQHLIEGRQSLRVDTLDIGYTGDMHARASCLSVLAFLPPEQAEVMFTDAPLRALTAATLTTEASLRERLTRIRRQGYAVDLEEYAEGVCCASAPFFDQQGTPAGSLTVSAPRSRFDARADFLVTCVRESAILASAFLQGGRLARPGRNTPL
ncbi:IclR family transcriptional regulator [Dactylosporangium sucinum]|uniref:IclR family transcriptional regulator n=1 Tax=Dactylosporangium sucinum TaxID=1424081 RepID=A0A917UBE9_9ACTN|nr:IclR family transcriptional regulator [Dactylosporangium sucinum]GGM68588.1 IclR family transcriptional regulator [Dactylosporangium sucinum]